jgi:hypothetical protein
MDASAWVTLALGITAIIGTLLGLIVKAAWTISRAVARVENDLKAVCDNVDSANRKIDAQGRQLTDTCTKLDTHAVACDRERIECGLDRKSLHDKITAIT